MLDEWTMILLKSLKFVQMRKLSNDDVRNLLIVYTVWSRQIVCIYTLHVLSISFCLVKGDKKYVYCWTIQRTCVVYHTGMCGIFHGHEFYIHQTMRGIFHGKTDSQTKWLLEARTEAKLRPELKNKLLISYIALQHILLK